MKSNKNNINKWKKFIVIFNLVAAGLTPSELANRGGGQQQVQSGTRDGLHFSTTYFLVHIFV